MGHRATVKDLLEAAPLRIGQALKAGYVFQLRHAPRTYETTYRLWFRAPRLCPWVTRLTTALTRRALLRWMRESGADVVVSTYPLATLALGDMRRSGRLAVPVANFVTDFGIHPLWVHPGADLTLTVDASAAADARRHGASTVIPSGPAVSARFDPAGAGSTATRAQIGLESDDPAVLIVAGSWGVGSVTETMSTVSRAGFVPVVVCGRDEGLLRDANDQARALGGGPVVMGWTSDMAGLMRACDALVENAGGLTALEAMRAGLPVITYDPIPGHGRANAHAMASAGVSVWAKDGPDLARWLDALTRPGPARSAQTARAAAIFREDPAALVASLVTGAGRYEPVAEAEPA